MKLVDKINALLGQDSDKNILFYFDEDGSLMEELPAIEAAGVQVIKVDQRYFNLKHDLEVTLKGKPVFLYHPFAKPSNQALKKYPLLDLLKANMELRLDEASEFLSTYGLPEYHLPLVKRYLKQLKTKTNQKKLARILEPGQFNESNLKLGLISLSLDFNSVSDKSSCIAKLIGLSTDQDAFRKTQKTFERLDLEQEILSWINQLLEGGYRELNHENMIDIAQKLKYNVLTSYIHQVAPEDTYAKLKLDRTATINRLQAFFQDWQKHSVLNQQIDTVFNVLATEISTAKLMEWYGSEAEFGFYSEEMLVSMFSDLFESTHANPLKTKEECIKWQRNHSLGDHQQNQIAFIYHSSSLYALLSSYSSFKFNKLQDFIEEYTKELHLADFHYRKAVIAFDQIRDHLYELEDVAFESFKTLNKTYDDFLKELNVEWLKALEEINFDYAKLEADKQFDFYQTHLKDVNYKIVVIISDALRYELGQELHDELIKDSRNKVRITPSLASIPSYTNLGMTNLLPHKGIDIEKGESELSFSIGGKTTVSSNRTTILQQADPDSTTIDYAKVMKFNQESGRAFFKNHRMVYVYHDWIDAIGDKRRTEHQTFEASSKAVEDIKRLIQKLYGWNVYHVLVTSDHGFLYNYNELTESSREDLPKTKGFSRDHVRFVVADDFEGKVDGYKLNLRDVSNLDTDLKVALPRAINRYRKQGNVGIQFVHGGASLQELITPVVTFYKDKKESSETVSFKRIDQNKRITTGSVKIMLIQEQPVSSDRKALDVILGIYSDAGELLSNEAIIAFDATSGNPKDRIQEIILSLNTKGSKVGFGYLTAYDQNDKSRLNPIGPKDLIKISSLMEKDEF